MKSRPSTISLLLLLAALAVVIGKGLQGLLHEFPLRALLWDESSFTGIANWLGYEWSEWVSSAEVNQLIVVIIRCMGGSFLLGGVLLCIPSLRYTKLNFASLAWHSALLTGLLLLATKENFWRFGYFIEHALLVGTPLLLLAHLRGKTVYSLLPVMRFLTALTFIGHGLYAAGYYPVPFHFALMTMEGLGGIYLNFTGAELTEAGAMFFLSVVGWLDFAAALLLLFPWHKVGFSVTANRLILSVALSWIIPWATLTTAARWWSNSGFSSLEQLVTFWGPEVLIRLPHIFIPVLVWRLIRVYTPILPEKS